MDCKDINKLIAHNPWSEHDYEEELTRVTINAGKAARRSKFKVDALFASSVAIMGLGCMRLFAHPSGAGETVSTVLVVAGALLVIHALNFAQNRREKEAIIAHWRHDEGAEILGDSDVDALRELSRCRPEALQRLDAWAALGLKLRERDRAAIEAYLNSQGVRVPDRSTITLLDRMFAEAGAA